MSFWHSYKSTDLNFTLHFFKSDRLWVSVNNGFVFDILSLQKSSMFIPCARNGKKCVALIILLSLNVFIMPLTNLKFTPTYSSGFNLSNEHQLVIIN